jgi:hypothetical protein
MYCSRDFLGPATVSWDLGVQPNVADCRNAGVFIFQTRVPPSYMCAKGKSTNKFFNVANDASGKPVFSLKPIEQYTRVQ